MRKLLENRIGEAESQSCIRKRSEADGSDCCATEHGEKFLDTVNAISPEGRGAHQEICFCRYEAREQSSGTEHGKPLRHGFLLPRYRFTQWKACARYPVIVEEVYITGESQCLDSESVAASCKPVIDALVVAGILPDDDPAHIVHPIPFTRRGSNPGIVIRLYPAPTEHGLITAAAMAAASAIPCITR